ncbi:ribonuclease J [Candidatus Mycoplasma mahonii]|uniref:ribonuclease J n=1 Tax=Candidatus Mycoplasma mahonii TaxID=3004105 RepID=UPI0026EC5745|nr:ribonuclease J [Candidatus Mycoplasma mahonii]WKX02496.1 ribonuclease J [Candidatus Mycoplasma mahonii]
MANINIFALGGQDENGKNTYVIELENDIYVINAGMKVPVNNLYGIDGIIADTSYLLNRKDRIKGIFLTHTHDEAFGALPWLLMDLPGVSVYGSVFSIKVAQERVSKYKIGHNNFSFKVLTKDNKIGSINVKTFELANSIAGSIALNFQTSDGDIIFTSNFTNADLGVYGKTDLENIRSESNDILALIMDARRANYHGKSSEKMNVIPLIEDKFQSAGANQRIIVGTYDEEMYTISEVLDLAKKYNRPVALYGRTFAFLYKMLDIKDQPKFIDFKTINKVDNCVVLVTGTWSRLYQRYERIADNKDVFLKFKKNDIIIQIAPPVNGLEVAATQALDSVAKIAPNIIDISDKDYYPTRPTQDDVEETIRILKPKFFLPIQALYRYLVVATNGAIKGGLTKNKTIIMQNGKVVFFKDKEIASQNGRIKEYGDVLIDGFGVGDISYSVVRERQMLSAGGLVTITSSISRKTKKIVGKNNIQFVGVVSKGEIKVLDELVNATVIQKTDEMGKFDLRELQNTIRKRVRKIVLKLVNKEPLVVVTFELV